MRATVIEWDGEPFAILVEREGDSFLVPPIVLDENGKAIEGRAILEAIVETGVSVALPVMRVATPADLAEVDQRVARISEELGVPVIDAPDRASSSSSLRAIRYLRSAPKHDLPDDVRLVHNFYPGPHDDPGRDREVGLDGFRIWVIDEPPGSFGTEHRCYCGWLDGREHYGTVGYVDERGVVWFRGEQVARRD